MDVRLSFIFPWRPRISSRRKVTIGLYTHSDLFYSFQTWNFLHCGILLRSRYGDFVQPYRRNNNLTWRPSNLGISNTSALLRVISILKRKLSFFGWPTFEFPHPGLSIGQMGRLTLTLQNGRQIKPIWEAQQVVVHDFFTPIWLEFVQYKRGPNSTINFHFLWVLSFPLFWPKELEQAYFEWCDLWRSPNSVLKSCFDATTKENIFCNFLTNMKSGKCIFFSWITDRFLK